MTIRILSYLHVRKYILFTRGGVHSKFSPYDSVYKMLQFSLLLKVIKWHYYEKLFISFFFYYGNCKYLYESYITRKTFILITNDNLIVAKLKCISKKNTNNETMKIMTISVIYKTIYDNGGHCLLFGTRKFLTFKISY